MNKSIVPMYHRVNAPVPTFRIEPIYREMKLVKGEYQGVVKNKARMTEAYIRWWDMIVFEFRRIRS